ncbi:triacylglycerol lipase 2-like isoform X1 [Macadamia integrifolia]|uniref:triacylglycerol lipase 2-like isoform X1 n=1 Tax=Macadamia integrifolia TaxID=60698 RepID=UPI001C4E89A8|nr:triacylglycerol lipase 2-like isoform X1 [Macadamia integrifolia]
MDLHLQRGFMLRWSVMMIVFIYGRAKALPPTPPPTPAPTPPPPPTPSPAMGVCKSSVMVHGYQCQEFYVKTEDGYVLNMQRISTSGGGRSSGGSRGGGKKVNKQPVLLQHGDGMTWLLNTPQQSLAFILADSGFDVWIANTRGTKFSRQHVTLSASQPEYWNWSWDELVDYDLPATSGLVYNQTGQKLHYVGHSMGTTIALASFTEGKLVDKLRSAALLSPVAYRSHLTTAIVAIAVKAYLYEINMLMGVEEFDPKSEAIINSIHSLCMKSRIDCHDLISSFTGENCCLNASTLELFWKNEPQPTSTKNMVHISQSVRDGTFSRFNYGSPEMNFEHYGQGWPPIYNLLNVPRDLPLFLSYGGRDALSDVTDVEILLNKLTFHDPDELTTLFIQDYAHLDFIMADNAKEMVYNALIAFLRRH